MEQWSSGGKSFGGKIGGKGVDGKGKGGYNGECHFCGKWGHTARFCRQKDLYMDGVRRAAGQVTNVEAVLPPSPAPASLDGLEASTPHRNIGAWDLGCLLKQNRFAALTQDSVEEPPLSRSCDDAFPPPSRCIVPKTPRMKSVLRKQWMRPCQPPVPIPEVELHSLEHTTKRLNLTLDSGAAEHVVGPSDLPHIQVRPSDVHATYVMANGSKASNRGEQSVIARTADGHAINFRTQVTDVHRPLMSVSRICDGGHRVVFESGGGYIESLESGERIHIRRDQNVYRLRVDIPGDCCDGFPRQGAL